MLLRQAFQTPQTSNLRLHITSVLQRIPQQNWVQKASHRLALFVWQILERWHLVVDIWPVEIVAKICRTAPYVVCPSQHDWECILLEESIHFAGNGFTLDERSWQWVGSEPLLWKTFIGISFLIFSWYYKCKYFSCWLDGIGRNLSHSEG